MDIDLSQVLGSLQGMAEDFLSSLPTLVISLLVLALFFIGARATKRGVLSLASKRSISYTSSLVIARLSRILILIIGVLVAISIAAPGFGMTELVSLLGIGGVAIGFAFRDILQNFLAGILILLTRPFEVGDQIIVGDYEGTVETIEIRATTLKTYDNRRVVIPNEDLFTDSVIVNTAFSERRSEYDVGIGYSDDIPLAIKQIEEAIQSVDAVMDEPAPKALVIDLAGSSVNIRAMWWSKPDQNNILLTKGQVIQSIKQRLDEAGINIPFPIRTLDFSMLEESRLANTVREQFTSTQTNSS